MRRSFRGCEEDCLLAAEVGSSLRLPAWRDLFGTAQLGAFGALGFSLLCALLEQVAIQQMGWVCMTSVGCEKAFVQKVFYKEKQWWEQYLCVKANCLKSTECIKPKQLCVGFFWCFFSPVW